MKLYFVTTIRTVEKEINGSNVVAWDSRTVAFYETLEKAEDCIKYNRGDLNECGYYPWAVIEAVPDGLYPTIDRVESIFWEWHGREEGHWERMKSPPEDKEWQNYYETMPDKWGGKDFSATRFIAFTSVG